MYQNQRALVTGSWMQRYLESLIIARDKQRNWEWGRFCIILTKSLNYNNLQISFANKNWQRETGQTALKMLTRSIIILEMCNFAPKFYMIFIKKDGTKIQHLNP